MARERTFEKVYRIVRRIPQGKVMTYGQISLYFENLSAQGVGWAMRCCPQDVPWQRVVNASGACSTERLHHQPPGLQQALLEREDIRFRPDGTLDLSVYRWHPGKEVSDL